MDQGPGTAPQGRIPHGVLSAEEIQELLAPLDVEPAAVHHPVLVLAPSPTVVKKMISMKSRPARSKSSSTPVTQ